MTFSLLTCPQDVGQLRQGRPLLQLFPKAMAANLAPYLESRVVDSLNVGGLNGLLWQFPLLPYQVSQLPQKRLLSKVQQAAKAVKESGAKFLGLELELRSLASVFQGQGLQVASGASVASFAALNLALQLCPVPREEARVLVVNPAGGIGQAAARVIAKHVRYLIIMGNYLPSLERLARRILMETGTACVIARPEPIFFSGADIILDFSGQDLRGKSLKPGAILWQPGGKSLPPESVQFIGETLIQTGLPLPLEAGLPPGIVRSSSAEALLMALSPRAPWPKTGFEVTPDRLTFVGRLVKEKGFGLAGCQSADYKLPNYLTNPSREFIIC